MAFQVLLIASTEADYWHIRSLFRQIQTFEFELNWVANFEAVAVAASASGKYDAYIIDAQLGEFTTWIEQVHPTPVILLSDTQATGIAALQIGIADYWVKEQLSSPLIEHSLRLTITHARLGGDGEMGETRGTREKLANNKQQITNNKLQSLFWHKFWTMPTMQLSQ